MAVEPIIVRFSTSSREMGCGVEAAAVAVVPVVGESEGLCVCDVGFEGAREETV